MQNGEARGRILLLDDDPFQLKVLSRQLSNLGLGHVETYSTGRDALECLAGDDNGESLIFLDLNMPEMDGVEFVRNLATRSCACALVLLSGEDERILHTAAKLARARGLNVLAHLQKPVLLEALRAVVGRWRSHTAEISRGPRRSYAPDEIRRAILGGELANFYQPKIDIATGEVAGVETLVRWQHPQDGLVYPDQFIGAAEECGLIDDLTRVVLGSAVDQGKRWQDGGMPLRVAVNVSMDNLIRLDFADFVFAEIARAGLDPSDIILEVTESRLMKDPLAALDILTRLSLKHVGLSIDDFGTGHSSLAQLRDIPFTELKIDRVFVHRAGENKTLRAIFESSLGMAKGLSITAVAEGVEDIEDWNFLCAHECDFAQGYFAAKPMPPEALPVWLAEWEGRRVGIVSQ